jgi:Asp-tRNA(Asn)/Glu-tRNA(Gln) amidotransferase A subunit family amidase
MQKPLSPLQEAREHARAGQPEVEQFAINALLRANSNAGRNTYISLDEPRVAGEIASLAQKERSDAPSLYGVPISIKDCFDAQGYKSSCGSRFYAESNLPAAVDSWVVAQVRRAGGIVTGKTHMQQLAYGITGENMDFGDCVQPNNAALLTGGSSSGAAASIQEGSALVAIGTDTGGSIRVPAALCGIVGYRSSLGIGSWQGGVHLAPSFDTLGLLFRDLRDGPALAQLLLGVQQIASTSPFRNPRIATVQDEFLHDCDDVVIEAFSRQKEQLYKEGTTVQTVATDFWHDSIEIFAAIQANEAAAIQRQKLAGRADFSVFEPQIADRLAWGESLSPAHITQMRERHIIFRATMDALLTKYDFLMLPCAPMPQLRAGVDHSKTRPTILRYTTPASLAGMPTVTLPHPGGAGMQLIAARGRDAELLAYAANLQRKESQSAYTNLADQ